MFRFLLLQKNNKKILIKIFQEKRNEMIKLNL